VSDNASSLLLKPGGGLTSQRTPYVSVRDEIGDQVSCVYAEKFVACGDLLLAENALMETVEAVLARAPVAPLKV
jgi:hypothetical protein